MELKEFIKTAIVDICTGLSEAQGELLHSDNIVNPVYQNPNSNVYDGKKGFRKIREIDFEISVVVNEASGVKSGISVFSGFFGAAAGQENKNENSSVSKLKFTVPIAFKSTDDYGKNDKAEIKVFGNEHLR